MHRLASIPRAVVAVVVPALLVAAACTTATGGPVAGPQDTHCTGMSAQATS
jgi:hypothetical protein